MSSISDSSVSGIRSLPNPGSAPLLKNDVPPARHASSSGIRSSAAAVFGFTSWFSDVDTTLRPARRNRLISSTAPAARGPMPSPR